MTRKTNPKTTIGWREWLHFPDFNVRWIKAKVDTGARTSALHADDMELFRQRGREMVRFVVHPVQRSKRRATTVACEVHEMRSVTSSNGSHEIRPVVLTTVDVGGDLWTAEFTLTRRDVMGFRMLLGRQAVRGRAVVDPGRSFVTRRAKKKKPKT